MKVWITCFTEDYGEELFIDKVFDTEEKAEEYLKYKDQMTGDSWSYFSKEVE